MLSYPTIDEVFLSPLICYFVLGAPGKRAYLSVLFCFLFSAFPFLLASFPFRSSEHSIMAAIIPFLYFLWFEIAFTLSHTISTSAA